MTMAGHHAPKKKKPWLLKMSGLPNVSPTACVATHLKTQHWICEDAKAAGLSQRHALRLLRSAQERGLIFEWPSASNKPNHYANVPPPVAVLQDTKQRVWNVLTNNPHLTNREVAELCDISVRRVQQIKNAPGCTETQG